MKALVKFGKGLEQIGIREVEQPIPKTGELLVRVMAAGICGTDLHIMQGEYPCDPPIVLGHEYTGVVEALGPGVTGFEAGDQIVSLTAAVTCGSCYYCREALYMLCDSRKSIGSGVDGAMAEYLVIPARLAYKVPGHMAGKDTMALSEPVACCIRAVYEMARVRPGDVAVVSGPGTIGQITAQLAKLQGAVTIVAGTPSDRERLALAKQLGADAVTASDRELAEAVNRYAPQGADIVFECAGAEASLRSCLEVVRKAGHLAQVGLYGKSVTVDMDRILTKELSFSTSYATEPTSWDRLIRLFSENLLEVEPLISARVPLEDWRRGFDMALGREEFKVFLTMNHR